MANHSMLIPPGVFDFFPVFVELEFGAVFVVVAFFAEMVFCGVLQEHHLPAGQGDGFAVDALGILEELLFHADMLAAGAVAVFALLALEEMIAGGVWLTLRIGDFFGEEAGIIR